MFPWQDIRQEAAIDKQTLTVGGWRIQPEANLIKRDGVEATIQPLSMDILVYLARRAGEVVTAQELLDTFWARRVVGDDAVHRRIADLRRQIGIASRNCTDLYTGIAETRIIDRSTSSLGIKEFLESGLTYIT